MVAVIQRRFYQQHQIQSNRLEWLLFGQIQLIIIYGLVIQKYLV